MNIEKQYYHYIAKIYDSLRSGEEGKPLYLATKRGVIFEDIECLPYMSIPNGGGSSITPKDSQCSVSSIKFDIVNVDYTISQWLYERLNSGNSMTYGEMVDIYAMCRDKTLKLIYRGLIRSIDNDVFESKYTFEIADFQERLKASIFDRELSKYNGETIDDINKYRMPTKTINGIKQGFSIKEIDEGETDDDGNSILTRVIVFEGHPVTCIELIFQAVFSTPQLEVQVPYLTNQYENFVDLVSLNEIREVLNRPYYSNYYLEIREPIDDPYEWLIDNVYKPCAIFPYLSLDGKLGIKLHRQPTIGTEGITLDESNIISIDSKNITDENIVNNMIVKYEKDFKEDKERIKRYFTSISSFNKFRMLIPSRPDEYIIAGVNKLSATDKATFAATLSDSIFSRYGYPGVELELTVPLEVAVDYKVGDYLFIEHKTLIAWEGDTQGLPGIKEETGEIVDPYDGLAYFDVGHEWGAFLGENTLGKAIDGTWVITTTQREISHKIFNSQDENFESCVKNHTRIEAWLKKEGIA